MSIAIFLQLLAVVYYGLQNYYYLFWGMQLGYLVTNIFVGIDYWADLGIMKPEAAHVRYMRN